MRESKSQKSINSKSGATGEGVPAPAGEQRRLIAEAAYYRALHRGFEGGDPVQDWIDAEREISRQLPSPQQQKQELAAYEKLRERVRHLLGEARQTVNADTIRHALDQGVSQLRQIGGYTTETLDKVRAGVEKDLAHAAQTLGPTWEAFSDKTADLFHVWRDHGNRFLGHASSAVGDWMQQAGSHLTQQTYHTGEMAVRGALECTACGERLTLETSAHLPVCAKCRHTEFRRV